MTTVAPATEAVAVESDNAPTAKRSTTAVGKPVKRLGLPFGNLNLGLVVANAILATLILRTFHKGPWLLGVTDALAGAGFLTGAVLLMQASPHDQVGRIFGGVNAFGLAMGVTANLALSTLADHTTVPNAFWALAANDGHKSEAGRGLGDALPLSVVLPRLGGLPTIKGTEMAELAGKGAIVTGGSRGIGRAIVERLAGDGATVVFNYARSTDAAADVERAVRDAGGRAVAHQIDLATPGAVTELMAVAAEHLDGLDILVNNVALDGPIGPIADMDEELWDQTMTVNAKSAFLTTRHAARTMRDDGRIINISTMNTTRPAPGNAAYVASKGAIEQLTKVAAVELGARRITVNVVCPGATDTAMLHHANPDDRVLTKVAALTPLGRLGEPDDIAAVVSMLAGPDGRWLTGQIINATGGLG